MDGFAGGGSGDIVHDRWCVLPMCRMLRWLILYATSAWRAVEDHYAFMADKEHWAKCHEAYDPCGTFDINIRGSLIHVPFNSDPYIHMNKAVTEFTMMELKPAENAESIESVLRREFEEREALLKDEGLSRGRFTWGCPGEIEGLYVIMTGWDSVEVRCHRSQRKVRVLMLVLCYRTARSSGANMQLDCRRSLML